ncbi:hypothetical protein SAMN04487948_103524 [Halogranum amylolyticum]|uniref:Uncharacterized protein n=1 Tax=Halogranum amylolyticum TaxID=660520 RepID=A0A1H8R780_9EURY|nr:hypothetical protein [Halogranum amylolyticum]SEO61978.1 hypothetical protein SAMN04487948_103524 [Halogranum amylolyticum]
MSTIRPTDRELVPVGWVQTSWGDTLRFAHRETGLHLEAACEGPSAKPCVGDTCRWRLRCRKSVGETETVASLCRASTEQRAREQLDEWMQTYNRLREQYDWDDTVAVATVADRLCGESEHAPGIDIDDRQLGW